MDHNIKLLAGAAGLEPTKCQSQSLVPYRLGYAPLLLVQLGGFEPPAHGLEVRCSILLSYSCKIGAGEGNRTLATSLEGWGSTTELHPQVIHFIIIINIAAYFK